MARLQIIEFPDQPEAFDVGAQPEVRVSDGSEDLVYNGGTRRMCVWVDNATGASVDVTLSAARPCIHGDLHPAVVPVPDGFTGFITKELDYSRFNDVNQDASIQYSAAGLRVAAVSMD